MKPVMTIAAAAVLSLLAGAPAFAANDYTALLKARKFAEVELAANAKLAQDSTNIDALVAKHDAILGVGLESRIEEAVKLAEQCVAAHPQSPDCHIALGNALGTKAMHGGLMAAMGYVGTIRDAFKKAVELDPRNLEARFALFQFYQQAPAIAGGGSGKAKTLAADSAAINAEAGKLMFAMLDLADDQLAKAETAAMSLRPGGNEALQDSLRDLLINLGNRYLNEKRYADSERLFREVQKRYADTEWAPYGLARVQQEQGKHREAIAGFEQALAITAKPHMYYRIGQSWQALGEKAKASAMFEKALSFKTGLSKKMKSDAEDQIKALKRA
jgi:tetratricopeptide (TPR) repeat protein